GVLLHRRLARPVGIVADELGDIGEARARPARQLEPQHHLAEERILDLPGMALGSGEIAVARRGKRRAINLAFTRRDGIRVRAAKRWRKRKASDEPAEGKKARDHTQDGDPTPGCRGIAAIACRYLTERFLSITRVVRGDPYPTH